MGIRFQFDSDGNPIAPTLILSRHSGKKIGLIVRPYQINLVESLMEYPELSFAVNKDEEPLWKQITDFKLVYCLEWDTWLQMSVNLIDGACPSKTITATGLCRSELSQILLHGLEFNTEDDIAQEDYEPRVLYDPWKKSNSILDAVMEKAPHYSIKHVDASVAKLQKVFTFDGVSIEDAISEICEECHIIAVYNDHSNPETKMPAREVSFYDLETICNNCGHRGEYSDVCPECGSTDLNYGYGNDTTIFISKSNLTEEVQYTTDVDSVKNTFKLVAGDDIMTAAIRACNPNGTDYIQYINEETKEDMPVELVAKLDEYDELYKHYQKDHVTVLDTSLVADYNDLVDKYHDENPEIPHIETRLVGYPALMNAMYDIIDFEMFIENSLMPADAINETTAEIEAAKLTPENLSPIGLDKSYDLSLSIVNNMVLSMASYVVDKRFNVRIKEVENVEPVINTYGNVTYWVGRFIVTSSADETQTVTTDDVAIIINDDTELYIKQRTKKILDATEGNKDFSINKQLEPDTPLDEFEENIKLYNINVLHSLKDACMSVMDSLQSEGVASKKHIMHDDYYMNYFNKLNIVLAEIVAKEKERDETIGNLRKSIETARNTIQDTLNFENYVGTDLYKIFCTYRREDIYKNDYYISDGLNNQQIFENAREFYETAEKEIYKSAVLQHSISATLKNLLVIPEFEPLRDKFELGNWLRIDVDGDVFRLRLIRYEVSFDELQEVNVEFSDVTKTADGVTDIESLLSKTSSMASSYGAVMHQVDVQQATKRTVQDWVKNGFDATLTRIVDDGGKQDVVIDEHGILIREYDDITETYHDTQMKFINSILAITDDNWESIRTALGNFVYQDPVSGKYQEAYGLIAETIVGDLILGKTLRIHNESNNLVFDDNGLNIYNAVNSFRVNPNSQRLFSVSRYNEDMLWFDETGMLHIEGDGAGLDISNNGAITGIQTHFSVMEGEIKGEISNVNQGLQTMLRQTADAIRLEAQDTTNRLQSALTVTASEIRGEVSDEVNQLQTLISQTAGAIRFEAADIENSIRSELQIKADEISSRVTNEVNEIYSTIIQKEDSIRLEVNSTKDGLQSYFEQAADKIQTEVRDNNTQMYSRISQTSEEIRLLVADETNQLHSLITQTDSEIRSVVANEVSQLSSTISQTEDAIRLLVADESSGLRSSITVNADKIESIVGDTTRISQTLDSIALVIDGGASIVLTDGTIEAIANAINLNGIVTFEGLDSAVQSMFDDIPTEEDIEALITTSTGNSVFYSATEPTRSEGHFLNGDIWYVVDTVIHEGTNIDPETGDIELITEEGIVDTRIYINGTWTPKKHGATVIMGGTISTDLIVSEAITTEKIATDALMSRNYSAPTANTDGYSADGTYFNLSDGSITSTNFKIDGTTGDVSFKGDLEAGHIGGLSIENGVVLGQKPNDSVFYQFGFGSNPISLYDNLGIVYFSVDWDGGISCNGIDARYKGTSVTGSVTSYFDDIECDDIDCGYIDCSQITIGHTIFDPSNYWTKLQVKANQLRHSETNTGYYTFRQDDGEDGTTPNRFYVEYHNPSSDERLKNIIDGFDLRYKQFFMETKPIIFKWKDAEEFDSNYHWGFGAQSFKACAEKYGILETFDNILGYDTELDRYTMNYKELPMLNWYMTQENTHDIESLQSKLDFMIKENMMLKKYISELAGKIDNLKMRN